MSLIFATQLTAAATAALAAFAIVTAVFAYLAYRKQSQQVTDQAKMLDEQRKINAEQTKVLTLQATELGQSLAERRTAQASKVFIWTEPATVAHVSQAQQAAGARTAEGMTAHLENASRQPVYELEIAWYKGTAPWREPDRIGVLMPDEKEERTHAYPEDLPAKVDRALFGAVAHFRDAAGVHWRIRPDGRIDEIPTTG